MTQQQIKPMPLVKNFQETPLTFQCIMQSHEGNRKDECGGVVAVGGGGGENIEGVLIIAEIPIEISKFVNCLSC